MNNKNKRHPTVTVSVFSSATFFFTWSLCSSIMIPVLWSDSDCFAVGLNVL